MLLGGYGGNGGHSGGSKQDMIQVKGGKGEGNYVINNGGGNDHVKFKLEGGSGRVEVNGQAGRGNNETFELLLGRKKIFTILDKSGRILKKRGEGGPEIVPDNIDNVVINQGGNLHGIR